MQFGKLKLGLYILLVLHQGMSAEVGPWYLKLQVKKFRGMVSSNHSVVGDYMDALCAQMIPNSCATHALYAQVIPNSCVTHALYA